MFALAILSRCHGLPDSTAETGASVKLIPAQLVKAIRNGEVAVVRKLLEGGAEVNARDAQGNTPLILAALYAQSDNGRVAAPELPEPTACSMFEIRR